MRSQMLAIPVVAALSSFLDFPECPGLIRKPEPRHEPWNVKWAEQLAREVREADAGEGFELIFYGDSITEQWRGTDQGGVCSRCLGDTRIYKKYFGQYRSDVLAVGGDQIAHLLWRLQHGDLPRIHLPDVVVTMIGTNDLGAAADCSQGNDSVITEAAEGVIGRLKDTVALFQDQLPDSHLVMLAILPRGDGKTPDTTYQWPGRYTAAIQIVNDWLAATAEESEQLTFLDCGGQLLQGGKISPDIQVDGLHPSPQGMELMAQCISPVVDKLMARRAIRPTSAPILESWLGKFRKLCV